MMPPAVPLATYRLQFSPSFGFDDAAAIVPYLKALGISHLYAAGEASFSAWYYEHRLPIEPTRYSEILQKVVAEAGANDEPAGRALFELAARYRGPHNPSRGKAAAFKAELAAIAGSREVI